MSILIRLGIGLAFVGSTYLWLLDTETVCEAQGICSERSSIFIGFPLTGFALIGWAIHDWIRARR